MADMLNGYGLSHLFMVPAVLRRTMVELERRTGIRRLHVQFGEIGRPTWPTAYAPRQRASGGLHGPRSSAPSTSPPACGTPTSPTLRSSP